jgi:hypothetical protein
MAVMVVGLDRWQLVVEKETESGRTVMTYV